MDPIGDDLLRTIKPEIGYREGPGQHSKFGEWYAVNVAQDPQYRTAPWCAMFIAWAAQKAGAQEYVGQFAWTPSQARWFENHGAWTRTPEPGALVFFDWSGGKDIKGIDHVGVVESVNGGTIHTIEGNVDRVWLKRKTRDQSKVVGYGLPRKVKEKLTAISGEDGTAPQAAGRIEVRPALAPGATTPSDTPGTPPVSLETTAIAGLLAVVLGATFVLSRLRLRASRVPAGRHRRNGHNRHADPWAGMTRPAAGALPRAQAPPDRRTLPSARTPRPGDGPDTASPIREAIRVSRPSWAHEPYHASPPARTDGTFGRAGTRIAGPGPRGRSRQGTLEPREDEKARAA